MMSIYLVHCPGSPSIGSNITNSGVVVVATVVVSFVVATIVVSFFVATVVVSFVVDDAVDVDKLVD